MGSGSSVVVNPRSIVVVGAGYAGASFASKLIAKRWIRRFKSIVLVDRSEALHHCPCSCRAVVQDGWAEKLFYSYTKLTEAAEKQAPGVFRVEQGTVTAVNAKRLEYVNQSGVLSHLDFDVLVLATGSQVPFPGKDTDVDALASEMKYRAALSVTKRADRIAIVGGGPVGVELAGEISFAFPGKDVTLFHSGPSLLSKTGLKEGVSSALAQQLAARGVTLVLGETVDTDALDAVARDERKAEGAEALPDEVVTGPVMVSTQQGTAWEADVVFRCTGATVNHSCYSVGWLADATGDDGRLRVTGTLQVEGKKDVYAIGDCGAAGELHTMYTAQQQGRYVAEVLAKQAMKPQVEVKPYERHPKFMLVPLGPKGGAGQLPTGQVATGAVVSLGKGKDLYYSDVKKMMRVKR